MIPPKAIKPIRKNGRDSTEIAVGSLIAYRVFAQTQEGIDKAKKLIANNDKWLVPSMLPEYYDGIDSDLMTGKENDAIRAITGQLKEFYGLTTPSAGTQEFVDTQVYTSGDKFVDDGEEFVVKIETDLEDALEKTSDKITDAIDDILRKDQEKFEEFKAKEAEELKKRIEKINKPERVVEELTIKIPPAHYIQGQSGRWQPEFENDIDHAIYFAGKSPLPKGAKQREVLDWLKSLGLTYEQIHDHREKVLDQIRETISLPGVEEEYPYVYIDAVDQDFVLDTDEEEFDEIEDDLEGLDDLLNLVRTDDDTSEKEVVENIEEEIVDAAGEDDEDEGDIGSEDDIPDELLPDDVDPELLNKLLLTINKPKKESSYTSNKKIFDSIIVNFGRLQSTLDTINNNLERQNSLIKANIDTQLAIGELVSSQTELLEEKFDAILKEFEKQSDRAKDLADDEKRRSAEDSLESQRDAAGTRDIDDLTKGGGKSKRGSKIADYYKKKALMKLYRAMPRRLRAGIRGARKLKQAPSRIASRMRRGAMNRMPSGIKKVASKASAIRSASKMTRMPGVRTGPLRTAFAGMEYGERKGAGQSELQALGGTGASLAGGAGGAIAGKGIGYAIGAGIGGLIGFFFAGVGAAPGALIGGKIGAAIGSVAGGWMGAEKASELADRATGADKVTGEHETGTGLTKPGTALLHGTEAVIPQNSLSPMSKLGGVMLAATSQYINSAGAVAAPIAPTFKGIAGQMAKEYDLPSTVTQTNVGGSLPQLDKELRKVKEKKTGTPEEEFTGKEKALLDIKDEDSFAEKLLSMLDPEGKLEQLLQRINSNSPSQQVDPYTGPISGDTFNPLPGGAIGPAAGQKFGADRPGDRTHAGVDMTEHDAKDSRAPIVAFKTGKIIKSIATDDYPYGDMQIDHGNGFITRYLHVIPRPDLKVGDVVYGGQQIGRLYRYFTATGEQTHLHFEAYDNGRLLNPTSLITTVKNNITAPLTDDRARQIAQGTDSTSPATPAASPATPAASPQQTVSGKIIRSFRVGSFVYTEREGGVYTQNGKPISKEHFDAIVKNHPSVTQASISSPQQPQQNLASSITAPPQRQGTVERTMEIASLSYDNSEQTNGMLIINNQQPQMPPMSANQTPMMFNPSDKTSSELMKNLMLQRLTA